MQCEAAYEIAAKRFALTDRPFSIKDNKIVEHIGWEWTIKKFIEEETKQ